MIPSIGFFYDENEKLFEKGLKSVCKFFKS